MLSKKRLPLLILLILVLETLIYLWAVWTTDHEFVFNKCARNSGRVSSIILLVILLMIGYYGLRRIYADERNRDRFRVLMTLFTINHFIHLFYVVLTFNHHALDLKITDNKHGFVTFVFLLLIPAILWMVRKMNALLYTLVIVHLINVTYFICETFLSKVTEDRPAYHNQLGIVVLSAAVLYVLYRSIRENIRF